MRLALVMLFLISASMAQFEDLDQQIYDCQQSCCENYGGSWDEPYCVFEEGTDEIDYYECSNGCLEGRGREISGYGSGNLCCAPGFLVFGLVLTVMRR